MAYILGILFYISAFVEHFRWWGLAFGTLGLVAGFVLSKATKKPPITGNPVKQSMGEDIQVTGSVTFMDNQQAGGGEQRMGNGVRAGGVVVFKGNKQS